VIGTSDPSFDEGLRLRVDSIARRKGHGSAALHLPPDLRLRVRRRLCRLEFEVHPIFSFDEEPAEPLVTGC
jgi:hypothetical protein